eukprot:350735-Rhodomonas_salina.2
MERRPALRLLCAHADSRHTKPRGFGHLDLYGPHDVVSFGGVLACRTLALLYPGRERRGLDLIPRWRCRPCVLEASFNPRHDSLRYQTQQTTARKPLNGSSEGCGCVRVAARLPPFPGARSPGLCDSR